MNLQRSGPITLYFQVSQRIEQAILSGELPVGSRLENEVTLGQRLRLSRPAFDNSGRAVEFGQHCYRPDFYSFEVTLVAK